MTMTRAEIIKRIGIGEQYLQRDDLTPEQRDAAEVRFSGLVAALEELDKLEANGAPEAVAGAGAAKPEPGMIDPYVLSWMNTIRGILKLPPRDGKIS